MGRAPCCDKENVKMGPWSPEEDAKLKAYIDNYGTGGNWISLPHKVGLKRCGKSCRLRWLNYLRPNLKHGGFTEDEDNIILSLYISIESQWSVIAAQLPGRTDNHIKNYWNTKLKKKLLGRRNQQPKNMCGELDHPCSAKGEEYGSPTLSKSALERLQLHMQLQGLQNPKATSFYNTPTLFPNLHPLQEKMIRSLQSSSEQLASLTPIFYPNPKQVENKGEFIEQQTNNFKVEEVENTLINGATSSSHGSVASFNPHVKIQKTSAFGATNELNDVMNNGANEVDC